MKTYYAVLGSAPSRSFIRSLAEPLFVLGCIAVVGVALWLTKTDSPENKRAIADAASISVATR